MNVLMLGWEFPPHISGGLGVACHGLVWGLKQLQTVDVQFVLPRLGGGEEEGLADFVPLYSGDADPDAEMPSVQASAYDGAAFQDVLRYARCMDNVLARAGTVDLIHAHDWLTFPAAIEAKEKSRLPFVAHVHSTEVDRAGRRASERIVQIEKLGMDRADVIIAVSAFTRQVLVEHYGIDRHKIRVVHNGCHDAGNAGRREQGDPDSKVVAFIGRMTFQKGPKYFVEAAKLILQKNPDVRFVMAGTGELLPVMKSLVQAFRISERFEFPGFLDQAGVQSLLARSDVYVMPSVAEPFGIGALEAIHAEVPVVLSQQSGMSEVVDSVVKIDHWNTAGIAEAVLRLLADPEAAARQAAGARQEARGLSWTASAASVTEIYQLF